MLLALQTNLCDEVETVGYVGRFLAYKKTGELLPYVMQSTLLLLAPVLFAASIYMTLGRIVRSVQGDQYSLIRLRWLTSIFVTGDVLCFMIQGGGAGMLVKSTSASDSKRGENIIIGGLIFQILVFAVFVLVAVVFNIRARQHNLREKFHYVPWQTILFMLYVTSGLIMLRNIFRVVEYAMGQQGYLLQNEWCIYVFDGLPMLLVVLFVAVRYPSKLYKKRDPAMLGADESGLVLTKSGNLSHFQS